MTILKGNEDGFSYFSLISVILFSNQDRACVKQQSYKHPMKIKLQQYNAFRKTISNIVVSSIPVHREMYWIQHYVIKFVRDLWQIRHFHYRLLICLPLIKQTTKIYWWKWYQRPITLTHYQLNYTMKITQWRSHSENKYILHKVFFLLLISASLKDNRAVENRWTYQTVGQNID
jgi:hypothetical protein